MAAEPISSGKEPQCDFTETCTDLEGRGSGVGIELPAGDDEGGNLRRCVGRDAGPDAQEDGSVGAFPSNALRTENAGASAQQLPHDEGQHVDVERGPVDERVDDGLRRGAVAAGHSEARVPPLGAAQVRDLGEGAVDVGEGVAADINGPLQQDVGWPQVQMREAPRMQPMQATRHVKSHAQEQRQAEARPQQLGNTRHRVRGRERGFQSSVQQRAMLFTRKIGAMGTIQQLLDSI